MNLPFNDQLFPKRMEQNLMERLGQLAAERNTPVPSSYLGQLAAQFNAVKKIGDSAMKLDWKVQPVPGKSMFNLELGTSYADVVNLLKECEISEGVFQIENSGSMRMIASSDEQAIRFKKMEDKNYDWKSDLALLHFQHGILKSITAYLNESYSYRGLILGEIGLGQEIRALEKYFTLEYDGIDEAVYAFNDGKLNGLELQGTSCDLSVDPTQKIGGMKVFVAE